VGYLSGYILTGGDLTNAGEGFILEMVDRQLDKEVFKYEPSCYFSLQASAR
jgi:hypothetical protein